MINYKCYNIKAEAKFGLAEQGFERSRGAAIVVLVSEEEALDPVCLF